MTFSSAGLLQKNAVFWWFKKDFRAFFDNFDGFSKVFKVTYLYQKIIENPLFI